MFCLFDSQIFVSAAGVMLIRDRLVQFYVRYVVPFIAMIAEWGGQWEVLPSANLAVRFELL
jgi:hypothetical protein